jgi:hypothetical protein
MIIGAPILSIFSPVLLFIEKRSIPLKLKYIWFDGLGMINNR